MTSLQTMLSMGAFIFLTSILLSFYRMVDNTGNDVSASQDGILATSIGTSYIEIAQGKSFDAVTDTSSEAIGTPSRLTQWNYLGPDGTEDSLYEFNDFDDFRGFTITKEAGTSGRRFTTLFDVYYVSQTNVANRVTTRTFTKRMDLKTWRSWPPPAERGRVDTVRQSMVLGYFHFD